MAGRYRLEPEPPLSDRMLAAVRDAALPLSSARDLDPLLEQIGDAKYVLLGEASHGTHEYYTWRTEISRRLIEEKGFSFIAVEGDWPDCYHVNQFVTHASREYDSARAVLHAFDRWPTWMWSNEEVLELIDWLQRRNAKELPARRAGFYGLDVYSLWDSMYQVLGYLGRHDSSAIDAARRAFRCFEPYGEDVQEYARATRWIEESCENEVVSLLSELRKPTGDTGEEHFNAEQNALVMKNAEHYYRTMVRGGPDSWNVRDRHMVETLERLMRHHGPHAKAIVWEHNTHIGDARETDMAADGMVNVGQLVREAHEQDGVVLVGFSSYRGSVIAGDEWDATAEKMPVPPARPGSWEEILHRTLGGDHLLPMASLRGDSELLIPRGHRAIGVVYHPDRERFGNYVPTVLPRRYDALIYLEETRALTPLFVHERRDEEIPETYPSGV